MEYHHHLKKKEKKKKNDIRSTVRYLFDELPEDLKINILRRLPTQCVAGLACVSKSLLHLITTYCFPKTASLPFVGLIQRLQIESHVGKRGQKLSRVEFILFRTDNLDTIPPFKTSAGILPLGFDSQTSVLLDSCNGLLLFCHPINAAAPPLERLYSYFVLNLFSDQSAIIGKPLENALHMYAALAYDPSKSSFYRVVRFDQGFRCLNVYNSQTRRWKKLEFWLENDVTKAEWIEKQSVFFQGEIYRLSMSGHLLRFVVDQEVSLKDQAQAINLPEVAIKLYPKNYCLGLCNDQINFMVFDNELRLCIWVLSTGTYEWSLRRRLSRIHQYFACKNSFCPPLGFHPYMDIVFVGLTSQGLKSSIIKISFGKDIASAFQYSCQDIVRDICDGHFINWHNAVNFPLSKCPVPFANGTAEPSTDDFTLKHVDDVIDDLLRRILPYHQSEKRKSALEEDSEEEDRQDTEQLDDVLKDEAWE